MKKVNLYGIEVEFYTESYGYHNSTAIKMKENDGAVHDVTKSIPLITLPPDYVFLNVASEYAQVMRAFIEDNGIGKSTGVTVQFGYTVYPMYHIDVKKLKTICEE